MHVLLRFVSQPRTLSLTPSVPPPTAGSVDCLSSRFHQLLRQSAMPEPPPPEAFSHAPSSLAPLTIYENRRVHNCERTLGEVLPGRRKGLRAALASVASMDALRHVRAAATGHRQRPLLGSTRGHTCGTLSSSGPSARGACVANVDRPMRNPCESGRCRIAYRASRAFAPGLRHVGAGASRPHLRQDRPCVHFASVTVQYGE
jgi:hypothetical protein